MVPMTTQNEDSEKGQNGANLDIDMQAKTLGSENKHVESDEESEEDFDFDFNIGSQIEYAEDEDEEEDDGLEISWANPVAHAGDRERQKSTTAQKQQHLPQSHPKISQIIQKSEQKTAQESAAAEEVVLANENAKQKKVKSKRTRTHIELVHRMDLLCQLARALRLNKACDSQMLWGLAHTVMPEPFRVMESEKRAKVYVGWFSETFSVDETCRNSELATPDRLARVLQEHLGSRLELLQIFIILARSVGIPCRLVTNLHPKGRLVVSKSRSKSSKVSSDDNEIVEVNKPKSKRQPSRDNEYWAEILIRPPTIANKESSIVAVRSGKTPRSTGKGPKGKGAAPIKIKDDDEDDDDDADADDDDADDDDADDNDNDNDNDDRREVRDDENLDSEFVDLKKNVNSDEVEDGTPFWISIFPLERSVGIKGNLEAQNCYIVGISSGNFAMDVTRRYSKRWSATSKYRHNEKDGWWQFCVLLGLQEQGRQWLQQNGSKLSRRQKKAFSIARSPMVVSREEQELMTQARCEGMPTNLDGFRRHSTYVLLKHLRRYEAIKPGVKPAGYFKGTEVHLREHIAELKSKTGWRRETRVIRSDELKSPYKLVDPIRRNGTITSTNAADNTSTQPLSDVVEPAELDIVAKSLNDTLENAQQQGEVICSPDNGQEQQTKDDDGSSSEVEDNETGKISLYGYWQTDAYEPPEVGPNGEIPKNKYGNVEMWSPAHCPRGAEHVRVDLAAQAAKSIGIDYAPAMVGFEHRDFRMLPKIEGVIVASAHAQTVRDAAEALQLERLEKARRKRTERVLKYWEMLFKAVLVKAQLSQRYNNQNSEAAQEDHSVGDGTCDGESQKLTNDAPVRLRSSELCKHEFREQKRVKNSLDVAGFQGTSLVCIHCNVRKQEEEI